MTATVLTFPARRSSHVEDFRTVAEALRWYEAKRLLPGYAPPIDATGDMLSDQYLSTVFAGLLKMGLPTRIAHLHLKADEQERHRAHLDLEGHPGADAHAKLRDILRRWAGDLADAAMEPTTGGAA
jgi:hypothetical protein